jgi:hypothetical protein
MHFALSPFLSNFNSRIDSKNSLYLHERIIKPMKIFTNILVVLAVALIIFNVTLLDFKDPLQGNSVIAIVGIVASFCAVLILLIFRMSKKIVEKMNDKV